MKLENWSFVMLQVSPYTPPECAHQGAQGEVYGSSDFEDGERIITSAIVEKGQGFIKTQNSVYELGDAHPEYLAIYPQAVNFQKKAPDVNWG